MALEIKVPPLGESVTEATVAKWYKNVGDSVKADEILVELETDKVTLEVNAEADGAIKAINAKEGDTVAIGDILGVIEAGASGNKVVSKSDGNTAVPQETISGHTQLQTDKILSPAASKLAKESNTNLDIIVGSGKDGRITKGDVLAAPVAGTQNISMEPREERVKMSRLRQRIAERLKESQNTAAILTTFNEVDMTNIIEIRNKYKDKFSEKHKVKLGFMSFFVKAAIAALKEIPAVNAQIEEDYIIYKNHYDIGVAVGTEQGLVVPVVRDADQMNFAAIEQSIADYGIKARDGKLSMQDLTGGTFTISNGGVYGSLLSTPIINPPQSAILGMHKTQPRPVAIDGKVEIRPMMYLALSYDHRIIDGKEAVTFLVRVKENIEDPERLLFDV
jgi:2-oxoglutarate dehydrogenase E2 component (dihydrolipoamide succinyltransferase)